MHIALAAVVAADRGTPDLGVGFVVFLILWAAWELAGRGGGPRGGSGGGHGGGWGRGGHR